MQINKDRRRRVLQINRNRIDSLGGSFRESFERRSRQGDVKLRGGGRAEGGVLVAVEGKCFCLCSHFPCGVHECKRVVVGGWEFEL